MREASRHRMFPVGLYGILLVGLFGVTFPELVRPVETVARTVVALPLRAYSILLEAQPVLASSSVPAPLGRLEGQGRSAVRGAIGPPGYAPRVCRVLERRTGPLGFVDELILDATVGELRRAAPLVTIGSGLVGFVHLPSRSGRTVPEVRAQDHAPAHVRLLCYTQRPGVVRNRPIRARRPHRSTRIAARVACREVDAQGVLHFLVEPARAVDRWPLRCSLLDDSYLGSRLRTSGDVVTTVATDDLLVPAGLHVGRLMIWGYPEHSIPVGIFVEPVVDPRAISSVVVWEHADGDATRRPEPPGRLVPVRLTRFPAPRPVYERWMVTSAAATPLPDGAALVDGDRFLGRLRQPWSGQSLVSPFAASTRMWSLLLRTGDGRVHELLGRLAGRNDAGRLRLLVFAPDTGARLRGELFTGVNGPDCPAGFRIGTAEPGRWREVPERMPMTADGSRRATDHGELWITVPDQDVVAPQVFVSRRSAARGDR